MDQVLWLIYDIKLSIYYGVKHTIGIHLFIILTSTYGVFTMLKASVEFGRREVGEEEAGKWVWFNPPNDFIYLYLTVSVDMVLITEKNFTYYLLSKWYLLHF